MVVVDMDTSLVSFRFKRSIHVCFQTMKCAKSKELRKS